MILVIKRFPEAMKSIYSLVAAAALVPLGLSAQTLPVKLETRTALNSRLSNVHLEYLAPVAGHISFTYGPCSSTSERDAHHVIGRTTERSHDRLVWIIPEDASSGACISAWGESGVLLGRSEEQHFQLSGQRRRSLSMRKRQSSHAIPMTNDTGIDAWGPWFDGVELLKNAELGAIEVKEAKSKNVAIVGAGMSGLMTYLCLTQAGLTNVSIIEAGERLGGRVHTVYLSGGPFDYSYQEMGPMRFPTTITLSNETYNISDHQMVFQLAAEMNQLNKHDKNLSVDFIPWYQSSKNGLYYHNGIKLSSGLPPTTAQVAANASLAVSSVLNPSTQDLAEKLSSTLPGVEFMVEMAQNMFKAHREWLGMQTVPRSRASLQKLTHW